MNSLKEFRFLTAAYAVLTIIALVFSKFEIAWSLLTIAAIFRVGYGILEKMEKNDE